ncbi:MAG: hypothetical protein NVSMB45_08620 [Ginsengibacter sp.]
MGEGQLGDMTFTRGNLAIRDHEKIGRRIFLFTQEVKAFVKFEGELEVLEYNYFTSSDREGNDRVFFCSVSKSRLLMGLLQGVCFPLNENN